jgi:hypothetical protein
MAVIDRDCRQAVLARSNFPDPRPGHGYRADMEVTLGIWVNAELIAAMVTQTFTQ